MPINENENEQRGPTDVGRPMKSGFGGGSGPISKSGTYVLPPWALPAVKLYRAGRKSAIDDADDYDELWTWMTGMNIDRSKGDDYPYRCELCASEPVCRAIPVRRILSTFYRGLYYKRKELAGYAQARGL